MARRLRAQRHRHASHIEGASELSFRDTSIESLARLLPDENTTILICCNNTFTVEQRELFVSLYDYGYRNVYELAPLLDVGTTKLALVGTAARR